MGRFLVVDDNRAFADNLSEILDDAGHRVTCVNSGTEALAHVRREQFDCLLTDMRMPVMSGAQLVHEIRRLDPGLPAIVATAYSADEDLRTARSEGLLAVMGKPLVIPRLLELLVSAKRGGLVVYVEDDAALADNLSEVLQRRGFATVLAASVLETSRLGDLKPFAGIVDLRVPGGTDGQAMVDLAAKFPGLPLIVVTGHDVEPPLKPRKLYRKPFDTVALLAELEACFAERGARTP